jgi:hypothetical protein
MAAGNLALAEQCQAVADLQLPAASLIDQAVKLVAQAVSFSRFSMAIG